MKTMVRAAVAVLVLGGSVAVAEARLQGSGATFPQPLYERWVGEFEKKHPEVRRH